MQEPTNIIDDNTEINYEKQRIVNHLSSMEKELREIIEKSNSYLANHHAKLVEEKKQQEQTQIQNQTEIKNKN